MMQSIKIPAGHKLQIHTHFTEDPLGQRWQIAAWGQRDGVQLPIPPGWNPPDNNPNWQLIYQIETNFSDPPPVDADYSFDAYKYPLTIMYQAWAFRGGQFPSQDEISHLDQDYLFIRIDRTQDTPHQPNYSNHFADGWIQTDFVPPLARVWRNGHQIKPKAEE